MKNKFIIFIAMLFLSLNANTEQLMSKSSQLALSASMTMLSEFESIEKEFGKNWGTAWALDSILEKQDTCQPSISTLLKEMEDSDSWKYLYASLMFRGHCPEIPQSTSEAIKITSELAESGYEFAQRDLGQLYETGKFGNEVTLIDPNLMKAIYYYKLAIDFHNNSRSAQRYSDLLISSEELVNDYQLSFDVLERAIKNGKTAFQNEQLFIQAYVNVITLYKKELQKIINLEDEEIKEQRFGQLFNNPKYYDHALELLMLGSVGGDTGAMALYADLLTYQTIKFKEPSRINLIHAYMWSNIVLEVDHRDNFRQIAKRSRSYAEENLSLNDVLVAQDLTRNWEMGSYSFLKVD